MSTEVTVAPETTPATGVAAVRTRRWVSPRVAWLVVAAAPVVAVLPGQWGWLLAAVWFATVWAFVARDSRRAAPLEDLWFSRDVPQKLSIAVPNLVTVRIENRSSHEARLVVRETPPSSFAGMRLLGELDIGARAGHEVRMHWTPPSRGAYAFGEPGVRSIGPRGLAGFDGRFPAAAKVRVYPDILAVRAYALLARTGRLHELGVRAARLSGTGTQFESLREYERGDDYRTIDWKATARRARPVVRRFEAERTRTLMLAIDTGRLMTPILDGMPRLDRAINAALLLAYLGNTAGDQVGLLTFGRDVVSWLPPRRGHRQFQAILEALYRVEGRVEEPDYAGAMSFLVSHVPKRSLVALFTDLAGTGPSQRLLGVLGGLAPRHLPLVVTQRDRATEALALASPRVESDVYEAAVAEMFLHDRAAARTVLTSRGVLALDVIPEQLSVATVNAYLEAKARGRL